MKKRGPKPRALITEKQLKAIFASLEDGAPKRTAHEAAGVAGSTFYLVLERGNQALDKSERGEALTAEEKWAADVVRGCELAVERGNNKRIKTVARAGNRNPRWAAYLLEKRMPEEFGQQVKVVIEQELNGALDRLQEALPAEWYDVALRALTGLPRRPALAAAGGGTAVAQTVAAEAERAGIHPAGQPAVPAAAPPLAAD